MTKTLTPATAEDVRDAVADALAAGTRLEIMGGGTKALVGAPASAARLDMRGFGAVIDYDAPELVLTAGAGVPLAEIAALLAERRQALAFDPFDYGPLFGARAGASTIGGVVAGAVSGSRRLARGAVRDHLLGFKAVSGRGEIFVGGAKVVKNVTGYDLPKLMCGSWGRLAALTEVTLKVLPRPPVETSLVGEGLETPRAVEAMARAMGAPADVSSAAHLPPGAGPSRTLLRIEGFGPSVAARTALLEARLADLGTWRILDDESAAGAWEALRTLSPLADRPVLWRVHAAPSRVAALLAAPELQGAPWLMDWAGGLVWLAYEGEAQALRALALAAGGQAMLVRAPEALRRRIPALHPPEPGLAALEERVRAAFDPSGVFDTGRFRGGSHAD